MRFELRVRGSERFDQLRTWGGVGLRWFVLVMLGVALWLRVAPVAFAADNDAEAHAHHHHAAIPASARTTVNYTVPDVALVRDDGKQVQLSSEMNDGRPVVLTFIYTTCTTVCPLTSRVLSELQGKLGAARDSVHLMSISIDPEQDTPARLREYAQGYGAGPEWQHYTGTLASSVAAQRAFAVYRGDKMSHVPVTLVRTGHDSQWVRIDGFATADQLLAELQHVVAAQ
jgi:protein SCO1